MRQSKSSLPRLQKASQPFTSKSKAPAGASNFEKSVSSEATPSVASDADSILSAKKVAGRRFGIHAPHAHNPKIKGV